MSCWFEQLLVKRLSPNAIIPTRGSAMAAGYDLSAAVATVVPARGKAIVSTDLAIKVPSDCYGRIAPRSGLAWKHFIDTGAGVIDSDYRGNVGVILFNHSDVPFVVNVGDRVAQLILERIRLLDVAEVDDLDATERGGSGFGSTGVSASGSEANTASHSEESASKQLKCAAGDVKSQTDA